MSEETIRQVIRLREVKVMREVSLGKQERMVQPEDMECQGGSAPDDLSFHLRNNKWERKP